MANKYLILLVEDESNIASFITTVLRANQYEVKRSSHGGGGVVMASSYCPVLTFWVWACQVSTGRKCSVRCAAGHRRR